MEESENIDLEDSFVCQFTKEQTFSEEFNERIWVKQGEEAYSLENPSGNAYDVFKAELETLINT